MKIYKEALLPTKLFEEPNKSSIMKKNVEIEFNIDRLLAGAEEAVAHKTGKKELKSTTYDFSSFVGKLDWSGDAVKEQRKLRNEW